MGIDHSSMNRCSSFCSDSEELQKIKERALDWRVREDCITNRDDIVAMVDEIEWLRSEERLLRDSLASERHAVSQLRARERQEEGS